MKQEDRKKLEANGDFKVYKEKQVYQHSNDKKYFSNNGQDKILPAGDVISRLMQLPAEMDLWASRYKISYAAYDLACELAEELEKWDCCYSRLTAVREKAARWERAVEKIKAKYLAAEQDYKQYLEKEFGQK